MVEMLLLWLTSYHRASLMRWAFHIPFYGYAFAAWKADGTVVAWGNSGLKVKSRCSLNEGFPKLLFPSRGPYN